ncbi:MAG: metallophosphoesterase [Proteobacteria bacterium]|jgi:Icc protein|nr:metallophosphoesterase [Pseudomonadota bacterium]
MSKKILIISDTHFSKDNTLLFNKVDTERNINLLTQDIINEYPDYIFVLGDISQDGTTESYLKAQNYLNNFSCPKQIIMGNHDSNNISTVLSDTIKMSPVIDIDNHNFIFLSSYKGEGYDEGFVTNAEIEKIAKYYKPTKQNYLVIHHHFIKTGGIIDNWILDNSDVFCNYVNKFNFKAIFHGHVHNGYVKELGQTKIYATPSTCIQFALTKELNLEPIIGYQVINLMEQSYEQRTITKKI